MLGEVFLQVDFWTLDREDLECVPIPWKSLHHKAFATFNIEGEVVNDRRRPYNV